MKDETGKYTFIPYFLKDSGTGRVKIGSRLGWGFRLKFPDWVLIYRFFLNRENPGQIQTIIILKMKDMTGK